MNRTNKIVSGVKRSGIPGPPYYSLRKFLLSLPSDSYDFPVTASLDCVQR